MRILIFCFILFLSLIAGEVEKMTSNGSQVAQKSLYKKALIFYKKRDYKSSYLILKKYLFENLNNPDWQYYLGRSSYKLKKLDEAIGAFERVLILKPKSIRAKLEMAKIYFEMKKYDRSKELFSKVLNEDIPKNVKRSIEKYLFAIENLKKRNFVTSTLIFGLSYDSNINNSSTYDQYYIPIFNINANNNTPKKGEFAHQEIFTLDDIYDIGERGGFAIKNSIVLFWKTMRKYADKNIFYYSYIPSLIYKNKRYFINLALGYDRMFYGSNTYLHTFSISPSLRYRFSKSLYMASSIKLQKKKYEKSSLRKVRDTNFYSMNFSFTKSFNDRFTITPSMEYQIERKIDSSLTNIDLDNVVTSLATSYQIDSSKNIGMKVKYKNIKYKEKDLFFNSKRRDKYYNISANFSKKISKNFLIQAVLGYTRNSSNQAPYDYKKYYSNLNFIRRF